MRSLGSVWSEMHFQVSLGKHVKDNQAPVVEPWPKLPYSRLYRYVQLVQHAASGVVGPLALLGSANYFIVVAAFESCYSSLWGSPGNLQVPVLVWPQDFSSLYVG